jgi:hypothetical protein
MPHRIAATSALGGVLVVLVGSALGSDRPASAEGRPEAAIVLDGLNLAPGDAATRTVAVSRLQPSARRYRVSTDIEPAGDPMGSQLILSVSTLGSSCENGDGTFLFRGRASEVVLDAAADGLRGVTADALCLKVELPLVVGDTSQGRTVSVLLTVDAE